MASFPISGNRHHDVAPASAGGVWYTAQRSGFLGKLDPTTGEVLQIALGPSSAPARRVWSDSKGNIWVSEWNAGQVARYVPGTGEWTEWKLRAGPRPQAYAVYVDEKDIVWLTDFGANAVVGFDPVTEEFTHFPGTRADAQVRQLLGRAGEVWALESGTNTLMVLRTVN